MGNNSPDNEKLRRLIDSVGVPTRLVKWAGATAAQARREIARAKTKTKQISKG